MARYKVVDRSPRFLPVVLDEYLELILRRLCSVLELQFMFCIRPWPQVVE